MGKLTTEESDLQGSWKLVDGKVEADEVCRRIEWLVQNQLELVGTDDWMAIYLDPSDGRHWKLEYRQSHMHGGGPPSLTLVSPSDFRGHSS